MNDNSYHDCENYSNETSYKGIKRNDGGEMRDKNMPFNYHSHRIIIILHFFLLFVNEWSRKMCTENIIKSRSFHWDRFYILAFIYIVRESLVRSSFVFYNPNIILQDCEWRKWKKKVECGTSNMRWIEAGKADDVQSNLIRQKKRNKEKEFFDCKKKKEGRNKKIN